MKCRIHKCKAECCYNMAFMNGELELFHERIITPVIVTLPFGAGVRSFTDYDTLQNKCPFLRQNFKCNIYENRPEVCRKFGEIDRLQCRYIKK